MTILSNDIFFGKCTLNFDHSHSLIKKSEIIGSTGEQIVEFKDTEGKCIACAQCALVCPDVAIVEVNKE